MQYKALGPDGPLEHVDAVEEASIENGFATIILNLLSDQDYATIKFWGLTNYSVQDEDDNVYTMLTSEQPTEIPDELLNHVTSMADQILDMHFDLLEDFDLPVEILEAFWDQVWESAQTRRRAYEATREADKEYDDDSHLYDKSNEYLVYEDTSSDVEDEDEDEDDTKVHFPGCETGQGKTMLINGLAKE